MKRKIAGVIFTLLSIYVTSQQQFKAIDNLIETGRYQIALQELNKIESSFKSNYKIATIYDALDNHSKSVQYYRKAISFKDDYRTKFKLAKSLKKAKKYRKALKVYQEIVNADSKNLLAKYDLSKLYLQLKQPKMSKKLLKELILEDSKNANYHYQLGIANALLGKKFKKIDNFLDAYRIDNQHFNAIEKLAKGFTKLKDKDSSAIFIEKGLELNPNHLDLNKLKINSLYIKKGYDESIVYLKHIDSLSPGEHYTHKMLGKSYYKLRNYPKALEHFNKATKINAQDFTAYVYKGKIHLERNEIKEAMFSYGMATFVGKESRDEAHLGLAKVYMEMKLPKRAIDEFKLAVAENHKNIKASYLLAKTSDDYYKDKKIGYKLYQKYLERFEGRSTETDEFVKSRIKEIKKQHFLKGEILE
jgi:tetratricopeptide (TPR) repeat protein